LKALTAYGIMILVEGKESLKAILVEKGTII